MTASHKLGTLAEAQSFFAANPDIDSVDLIFTNMCGVPRGKRLRRHEVLAVYENGRFLPRSVVVVDITGRDTEETGLLWEAGDCDSLVRPVPGTLVRAPWADGGAAQFLTSFYNLDGTADVLDPRHVLGGVLDRFAALGLTPVVAVELEFYLLDAKRGKDGRPKPARVPVNGETPSDIQVYGMQELEDFREFFNDLYAGADVQGLPLESAISEYAAGQFELTLRHKPDALAACDDAIMYKRLLKALAQTHGMEATLMPKPFADSAGSGMHLHISLQDLNGNNVFASESPEGTALLTHSIAGMQSLLADSFAIFAPNANSYRRFKANSYAPVAPTWGVNNRTVSFRIPAGLAASRHVEHRASGADANPYLAMAAVLAAMHHGIVGKLNPGPATTGNGYAAPKGQGAPMPNNWFSAVDRFEGSELMRDYLGAHFVDMYTIVKRTEQERFFGSIPDIDYDWYLRSS
ncbi:MAG: glutamine synthetase family protein [Sphingomonadaceae bacterium]